MEDHDNDVLLASHSNNRDGKSSNNEEESMIVGMTDAFLHHHHVRQRQQFLRRMDLADQAERQAHAETDLNNDNDDNELQDVIDVLDDGRTVLRYDSYLAHQRYYDDLKHVDCHFIDYGSFGDDDKNHSERNCDGSGRLVIEQDKSFGKGGLCWDAAFILGEYLISNSDEWNHASTTDGPITTLVELGSGTGLAGLMVAKSIPRCHVCITDLPQLLPLMTRNVNRNFDSDHIIITTERNSSLCDNDETVLPTRSSIQATNDKAMDKSEAVTTTTLTHSKRSRGFVSANVLQWGVNDDYRQQHYDVIMGADVVASLYDPIALAETIHALCHSMSVVFVSYKQRLTGPHEAFEERLSSLFETVERIRPTSSRNRNSQVWILKATHPNKDDVTL